MSQLEAKTKSHTLGGEFYLQLSFRDFFTKLRNLPMLYLIANLKKNQAKTKFLLSRGGSSTEELGNTGEQLLEILKFLFVTQMCSSFLILWILMYFSIFFVIELT